MHSLISLFCPNAVHVLKSASELASAFPSVSFLVVYIREAHSTDGWFVFLLEWRFVFSDDEWRIAL
jgi:hypothetical protein